MTSIDGIRESLEEYSNLLKKADVGMQLRISLIAKQATALHLALAELENSPHTTTRLGDADTNSLPNPPPSHPDVIVSEHDLAALAARNQADLDEAPCYPMLNYWHATNRPVCRHTHTHTQCGTCARPHITLWVLIC